MNMHENNAKAVPLNDVMPDTFGGVLPEVEWRDFLRCTQSHSPRSIRLHPRFVEKGLDLPFEAEHVPWFNNGKLIKNDEIRPSQFLNFSAGDYYIQDAGSMLALALLKPQPGELICDLCAAPGGKASGILESISFSISGSKLDGQGTRKSEPGFLLANEPIKTRLPLLHFALARTGSPLYAVTSYDPEQLAERIPHLFDAVLVDAPCSGQTMVGRGKRDSNAFDANQIEHSAARQRRILQAAVKLLKPGGRLVYSTCTFNREENESQIEFLLEQFPGCWRYDSFPELEAWKSPVQEGCYRVWPHRDRCDGAFAASLRWLSDDPSTSHAGLPGFSEVRSDSDLGGSTKSKRKQQSNRLDEESISLEQAIHQFGLLCDLQTIASGGYLSVITPETLKIIGQATYNPSVERVQKKMREMRLECPSLASVRGKNWSPEYLLARLDKNWFKPHSTVAFSDSDAAMMVNGMAIPFSHQESPRSDSVAENGDASPSHSWAVATWNGRSLGWVKKAGNRWNNHLPKIAVQPLPLK